MLARCARLASTTPRIHIPHHRTITSTDGQSTFRGDLRNVIEILERTKPPSTPPVGTTYGSPQRPVSTQGRNPFIEAIIDQYSQKSECYSLYCQSTRNNTITTLTDANSQPVAFFSGGTCGFKKVNRSGYEAGYQCAVRMFKTIEQLREKKRIQVAIYFKGFGQGRDALQKALMTSEGNKVRELVVSVTDRTPIKIGGTRSKKARRC